VRTWGSDVAGSVVMLTGTYEGEGAVSRRLLDVLPDLVVLRRGAWASPVVPMLAAEVSRDVPGQQVVLDRLLDLLLVEALRAWFDQPDAPAPTWYRAHADPVVGPALRMLQERPADPWTVASIAAEAGVSRAALARRFNEVVGEPPMTFLAGWRMALAADLLLEPGASVTSVARQVGYHSPFTFSTAFKRVVGVSPLEHRRRGTATAETSGPAPAASR